MCICGRFIGTALPPRIGRSRSVPYWPNQTVRNMAVLTLLLGVIAVLAWKWGAPLEMPADAEIEHAPRPEWYFLSLFELRRHFNGSLEVVATVVIPIVALAFLIWIPWIDAGSSRRLSLAIRATVIVLGCGSWGWLTLSSVTRDRWDAEYQASERQLARLSARARTLADARGIPPEGAAALLQGDAKTQGPRLFAKHCLSCHSHSAANGEGLVAKEPSAANLDRFASRDWLAGLLDPERIRSPEYFGRCKAAQGDMAGFVGKTYSDHKSAADRKTVDRQMKSVAVALAAEAGRADDAERNGRDRHRIADGLRLMKEEFSCTDCHRFRDKGELGNAPDLTKYGSKEWLKGMISDPNRDRFYGKGRNDRMPAFAKSADGNGNLLSPRKLDLLVDWLRGDWFEP